MCSLCKKKNLKESKIISKEDLENFTHKSKIAKCGLCTNRCNLTINIFNDGEKYISGNRCEKPTGNKNLKVFLICISINIKIKRI